MNILATMRTWSFSMRRPQSPLGMEKQQIFGTRHGFMGESPKRSPIHLRHLQTQKLHGVEGLQQDFWINELDSHKISTLNHIVKFVELCALVNEINLEEDTKDDIKWKFTANGEYSAASAYSAQFEGMVNSVMMEAVWKS
jgi:hypothetical protein